MTFDNEKSELFVDPRGHFVERVTSNDAAIVIHYRDIPESDITTIHGLRVTTPIRTVIDLAHEVDEDDLARMVLSCLGRGLFTLDEAWARLDEPDMADDPGADCLRRFLRRRGGETGAGSG